MPKNQLSNHITKGIYKSWLAISATRLLISCLSTTAFILFVICVLTWFINTALNAPPLQFK